MKKLARALLAMFVGMGVVGCVKNTETVEVPTPNSVIDKAFSTTVEIFEAKEVVKIGYGTIIKNKKGSEMKVLIPCSFRSDYMLINTFDNVVHKVALTLDTGYGCVLITQDIITKDGPFSTIWPKELQLSEEVFSVAYTKTINNEVRRTFLMDFKVVSIEPEEDKRRMTFVHNMSGFPLELYPGVGIFDEIGNLVGIVTEESPDLFSDLEMRGTFEGNFL